MVSSDMYAIYMYIYIYIYIYMYGPCGSAYGLQLLKTSGTLAYES